MIALVANERSGTCDPPDLARRLRGHGVEVELFGIEQATQAAASGAERLVVAGGDGSLGRVAAAAASATLPLAVIPAGTAHDFARRLGLPSEVPEACRLAALGGRTRRLELAWMEPLDSSGERRPFVNVASAGLPAPAARAARSWKRTLGSAAYAAGALAAGLTARPVSARVEVDERELFTGRAWQVTVAASGAFGAGAAVEEADPADGALDVVAIPAGPRAGLVALAYHLRSGGITDHSPARHARCRRAVVEVAPGTPFNVDGELVPFGPARFGVTPAAYELVVG